VLRNTLTRPLLAKVGHCIVAETVMLTAMHCTAPHRIVPQALMPDWPCLLCLPGLPRVQPGISAQLQQAWADSCRTMLCVLCWVQGKEGIDSVLHLMRDYCIGREDIDFITGGWAGRWWAGCVSKLWELWDLQPLRSPCLALASALPAARPLSPASHGSCACTLHAACRPAALLALQM
jgi:hypothetical protein